MINQFFYDRAADAVVAAQEVGLNNIEPSWIYAQWCHETGGFDSALCKEDCNLGGLTTDQPTEYELANMGQPDGSLWYKHFDSYEDYARYFGRYLKGFVDGGLDQAANLDEYVTALKMSPSGAYFGDSLEDYLAGCHAVYDAEFGEG